MMEAPKTVVHDPQHSKVHGLPLADWGRPILFAPGDPTAPGPGPLPRHHGRTLRPGLVRRRVLVSGGHAQGCRPAAGHSRAGSAGHGDDPGRRPGGRRDRPRPSTLALRRRLPAPGSQLRAANRGSLEGPSVALHRVELGVAHPSRRRGANRLTLARGLRRGPAAPTLPGGRAHPPSPGPRRPGNGPRRLAIRAAQPGHDPARPGAAGPDNRPAQPGGWRGPP